MKTKKFNVVTAISMAFTITAAVFSIICIVLTGVYPAIFVLVFLALIPFASRFYAGKLNGKTISFQRKYLTILTIFNSLIILVVIWMSFVILIDRVFSKIL
jgi:hypothetical protein